MATILGKGNETGELGMVAKAKLLILGENTKQLIDGLLLRGQDGEINGWTMSGVQEKELREALSI